MRKFTLFILMLVGSLPLWAKLHSVNDVIGLDAPYSIDFRSNNEGWSAVDKNGDGVTWSWWNKLGLCMYEYTSAKDDYVSPMFAMKAGSKYKIKVTSSGMFSGNGQLSLVAGQDKQSLENVSALTIPTSGEANDVVFFEPTVNGNYYVGIRLEVAVIFGFVDPFYLTGVSIEEIVPEVVGEPIFTDDFNRTDAMTGWTALDLNNDDITWGVENGAQGITYNGEMVVSSNDLLISPAIQVTGGQDYVVSYTFAQTSAFEEDIVEVKAGNAATADGMTMLLGEETFYADNGLGELNGAQRLSAQTDGEIYVGFRIATAEPNGRLALTYISVTPVAKATPLGVTELAGTSSFNEKTVTLTWLNPVYDTENSPISGALSANIYENGNFVTRVENQLPGQAGSYTYSPIQFSGEVTFMVKAIIGANESEGVEVTINLDDVQGELALVHSFADPNPDEWYIESIGGTSVWAYSNWRTCFEYKYKLGQKYENDWLISPAVRLESGTRYVAKYEIQTSRSNGNDIAITLGEEQTYQAQTKELAKYVALLQNGFGQYECDQFSVEKTGDYYFGIHYTNVTANGYFDNLEIFRVVPSGLEKVWEAPALVYDRLTAELRVSQEVARVTLFDAQGRVAYTVENGREMIDLSMIRAGFYIVKADYTNGKTETIKILK